MILRTYIHFLLVAFATLLSSCEGEPLEQPEEYLQKLFGAEECNITSESKLVNGDTLAIIKVELVNVQGVFGKLESWQINAAVALAYYQQVDKSLLAEYDGISGEITETESSIGNYQSASKENALTVAAFAEMDSIRMEIQSVLKSRLACGNFETVRDKFDTAISSSDLVAINSYLDRTGSAGGNVLNSLVVSFRYVGIDGQTDPFVEIAIGDEVVEGWNVYKFTINKRTGKIVGITVIPQGYSLD